MNAEKLSERLHLLYSNQIKEPTPVQIQKLMTENIFLSSLAEETGIKDMFLLKKIFHPNGKPMTYKANNFKESLKNFVQTTTGAEDMLGFIDEKSIREKTGKLIIKRVIKRYNNFKIIK